MSNTFRRLTAFAIAAALHGSLAGFALAQGNPPASGAGGPPSQYPNPGSVPSAVPGAGPESAAASELPVLYVTSVEVLRTSTEPKLDIVRVTGLTSSQGWIGPQLVPTFSGKPLDDVLDLRKMTEIGVPGGAHGAVAAG